LLLEVREMEKNVGQLKITMKDSDTVKVIHTFYDLYYYLSSLFL
jgi:hypothetical protein